MSRLKQRGSGKSFLYRFDVDASQNFVKKMHVKPEEYEKYPGASHCDELPYLFKTEASTAIPSPTLDSVEFSVIRKMVETFVTFAATGDPNNQEIDELWTAIDSSNPSLNCMNFTNDKSQMMPLPEGETLEVWNEIFERENVNLC